MSDLVERAKAALEGVTPEPWTVVVATYGSDLGDYEAAYIPGVVEEVTGGADYSDYGPLSVADAEFIAQARTLVPELVAEIERLRARETRQTHQLRISPALGCGDILAALEAGR